MNSLSYVLLSIQITAGGDVLNGKDGSLDDVDDTSSAADVESRQSASKASLKIDKNLVPVDLRLHSYLSTLAKACPCPCSVGSREMTISELSADSLEDLHIQVPTVRNNIKLLCLQCTCCSVNVVDQFLECKQDIAEYMRSFGSHNHRQQ